MKRFLKITLISLTVLIAAGLLCVGGVFAYGSTLQVDASLLPTQTAEAVFYDIDGNKIERTSDLLKSEDIPTNLKNAFVAIEDKRFYNHKGYDVVRIGGAMLANVKSGAKKEGASTISQQLIKNTHLSQKKTYKRKLDELFLARKLEKQFTKDEIMTMYLDVIYFGNGYYGVDSAARGLFGKQPSELTLSECAILAGIVKNPSAYSPKNSIERAQKRRNLVLDLMEQQGYIDSGLHEVAANEQIVLCTEKAPKSATEQYLNLVIAELKTLLAKSENQLDNIGLKVYTYYSPKAQESVYQALKERSNYESDDVSGCAILCDNEHAGISAYYSTLSYMPKRQAGSVLKPLAVYAPALDTATVTAATPILDEKTTFGDYAPGNYKDVYYGWTTVREAVKKSMNTVAVKTLSYLGVDKSRNYLSSFGIETDDKDNSLTLALGAVSKGVTAEDVASGYMTLANGGENRGLQTIRLITQNGDSVYRRDTNTQTAIQAQSAYIMTDILVDTVRGGTAKSLSVLPYQVAAKTGTVESGNANSDAWCASYTTRHTLIVWHGGTKMSETGGGQPTLVSKQIYQQLYAEEYPFDFERPSGIVELAVDAYALQNENRLLLASPFTPDNFVSTELFTESNRPTEISTVFSEVESPTLTAKVSKNGEVELSFEARSDYAYTITRIETPKNSKSAKPSEILVRRVSGESGNYTLKDRPRTKRGYVEYRIKPSLTAGGVTVEGEVSTLNVYVGLKYFDILDGLFD